MYNDWAHIILKHLFRNFHESEIKLTDFLISSFDYNPDLLQDAIKSKRMMDTLQERYITYTAYAKGGRDVRDATASIGLEPNGSLQKFPGTLKNIEIRAKLTSEGYEFIRQSIMNEESEILNRVQAESQLKTNESVRITNEAVSDNLGFQKKFMNRTLLLSIITTIFILISAAQQLLDNTKQELKSLKQELQNSTKAIQEIQLSLKEINLSIQTKRIDTTSKK